MKVVTTTPTGRLHVGAQPRHRAGQVGQGHLEEWRFRDPRNDIATFEAIAQDNANGLLVLADPMLNAARKSIIALAASHRLPAIYEDQEFVQDGGLISYGPSIAEMMRRSAAFVDKILKGAHPSELPIEQPTDYELFINLTTAKALGLTISDKMLTVADGVIE